jgi:hypothetical protein
MASWAKGKAIANCIVCKLPILFELSIIQQTHYGYPPYSMTFIKKHYRKMHPEIFDQRFRR